MQYAKFTANSTPSDPSRRTDAGNRSGWMRRLRRLPDRHLQLQLSERILRRLSENLYVSVQLSPVLFVHLLQQSHLL